MNRLILSAILLSTLAAGAQKPDPQAPRKSPNSDNIPIVCTSKLPGVPLKQFHNSTPTRQTINRAWVYSDPFSSYYNGRQGGVAKPHEVNGNWINNEINKVDVFHNLGRPSTGHPLGISVQRDIQGRIVRYGVRGNDRGPVTIKVASSQHSSLDYACTPLYEEPAAPPKPKTLDFSCFVDRLESTPPHDREYTEHGGKSTRSEAIFLFHKDNEFKQVVYPRVENVGKTARNVDELRVETYYKAKDGSFGIQVYSDGKLLLSGEANSTNIVDLRLWTYFQTNLNDIMHLHVRCAPSDILRMRPVNPNY